MMPAPTHTPLTKTHATCHREHLSARTVATSCALLLLLSTSDLEASVCQRPVVFRSRSVTRSVGERAAGNENNPRGRSRAVGA